MKNDFIVNQNDSDEEILDDQDAFTGEDEEEFEEEELENEDDI